MTDNEYGRVSAHSSARNVNFLAIGKDSPEPIVGKLVYFDMAVGDDIYRSVGTVTGIVTENTQFTAAYETMLSKTSNPKALGRDLRKTDFAIQAVFKKSDEGWVQYGASLPTSPSTNATVHLFSDDILEEMVAGMVYPTAGYMRGLEETPMPMNIRDFSGSAGSFHSGIIGKSGSGKALDVSTPIPTPNGWTTMGGLKAGDEIFDANGEICHVTVAHPISLRENSYEVTFSDGSKILADANHLWYTETISSRKSASQYKTTRKDAIRRPYYSHAVTSHLRKLADECAENELITLRDATTVVSSVTGKNSEVLVSAAAESLPILGYEATSAVAAYEAKSFTAEKMGLGYPVNEILEKVKTLTNIHIRVGQDVFDSLNSKSSTQKNFTISELKKVFGYPNNSGAGRRFIDQLGVEPIRVKNKYEYPEASYAATVMTRSKPAAKYSKKDLLDTVAERGSRIYNDQREKRVTGSVKTTQEILDTLTSNDAQDSFNHSIPVAKAIKLPEQTLPIHPYTLGAWLGDGTSWKGSIVGIDKEIIQHIFRLEGRKVSSEKVKTHESREDFYEWNFENLKKDLISLGLLKTKRTTTKYSKFIPAQYLRTSITQRKDLLAGLMDTDGNATKSASVEFVNTNEAIARGVHEIAISLGYRATITEGRSTLYGVDKGPKWCVRWSTKDDVFRLSRKVESHRQYSISYNESKNNQRYITSVNPIAPIEMRCITVDSSDALYLAGKSMIPTHNTAMYSMVLGASMKHEHHAILVIDPQGQWSNENGSIFSPQALARSLGREVSVLRVSEDVQLPMDIDILGKMIDKTNLWAKFRRMGGENKEAFSNEVAERLAGVRKLDIDSRDLLTDAFSSIANSPSTLSRIYVKGERQDAFKRDLLMLAGEPIYLETGEEELIEADELADVEARWENILTAFKPLHSLFSKENLAGTKRRPLGGVNGFLTDIFKVRKNTDAPAPYVVLDMSPNVTLHAKAALDRSNSEYGMQKLLDNQDVKALILMMLLEEMKKASEVAFAEGGGNLNTQIVFDEAWRYAPASKASPEIDELAAMLEGFALDTRKFGIGWTYILQSPSDLRFGIWRQLTFVYSGYGLVGEDVRKLETLTDDVKQVDLYRQFISPASTGKYPFMITGPISPLIFTSSPSFINAFAGATEFLEHNQIWIDEITKRRSLPNVTEASLGAVQGQAQAAVKAAQRAAAASKAQTYQVGKVQAVTAPQTPVKVAPVITKPVFVDDDDLGDTPF